MSVVSNGRINFVFICDIYQCRFLHMALCFVFLVGSFEAAQVHLQDIYLHTQF